VLFLFLIPAGSELCLDCCDEGWIFGGLDSVGLARYSVVLMANGLRLVLNMSFLSSPCENTLSKSSHSLVLEQ